MTTIPQWREKEIDLAHAWLHEAINSIRGISPRHYNTAAIRSPGGEKFKFGRPLHSEKPVYRGGTSEQLKRDNFFY